MRDLSAKQLPTLGVVGAFTGICMGDFSEIHDVFDHLCPGIMTVGVAMMADRVAAHLGEVVPALRGLPKCTSDNWREVAAEALRSFGPTIGVAGFE